MAVPIIRPSPGPSVLPSDIAEVGYQQHGKMVLLGITFTDDAKAGAFYEKHVGDLRRGVISIRCTGVSRNLREGT